MEQSAIDRDNGTKEKRRQRCLVLEESGESEASKCEAQSKRRRERPRGREGTKGRGIDRERHREETKRRGRERERRGSDIKRKKEEEGERCLAQTGNSSPSPLPPFVNTRFLPHHFNPHLCSACVKHVEEEVATTPSVEK